jgi:hypothetical protein
MTQASWILLAGLGLATGLAGGALGAILVADGGPRPEASAPPPSNDGSVAVLRELVEEVRLLRTSIVAGAPAPASERAPVDGPSTDRLERSIERLAEVLASSGSPVQPRGPKPRRSGTQFRPSRSIASSPCARCRRRNAARRTTFGAAGSSSTASAPRTR